jgi:hypothetical protein
MESKMMYNNKFVTVVKVGGKILREMDGVVYIPFGSEYEIAFKNLHTTKALLSLTIDGEDVLDGHQLIVHPNGDSKVEGFMRGNAVSHKFKFIEKTQEISDYRGDKISDGLIRVSFKFEKPKVDYPFPVFYRSPFVYRPCNDVYGASFDSARSVSYSANQPLASSSINNSVSDDGITVKGSASNQSFNTGSVGVMETAEHSMIIQLKGETSKGAIDAPILVKTKVKCDTCGRVSFAGTKFCGNCGTSMVI